MNIKKVLHIPVREKYIACLAIILFVITASLKTGHCYPVNFRDSSGRDISIAKEPVSVVSLVPSITEIICRIGAGDKIKAITYHSTYPSETAYMKTAGGFLHPDLDIVSGIKPGIIFYNDIQKGVVERFEKEDVVLINLKTTGIENSFWQIELLGQIFNKQAEASAIIKENRRYIDIIQEKVARIPSEKRKRVMRLMGRTEIMTPGDDSFQNEIISLAGGIPASLGKKGAVVEVSNEEFIKFNPQFIYGCGGDKKAADSIFPLPVYRDVEAIKNRNIHFFPCDLTCRAATNTGYFISWLSAEIYRDEFADRNNLVLAERIVKSKNLDVKLDYINNCRVDYIDFYDYPNKSLVVEFNRPLNIVSTLDGLRKGITAVGNHYAPLSCWTVAHREDISVIRKRVLDILGKSEKDTSLLFTGADVDNLSIVKKRFRDMEITALVTGGVTSNAMRMSRDEGSFYEPGTINIIILPNMKLSEPAMTNSLITATEAKSAALQDLDIRSSYSPEYQATGTGTDNIVIVEGNGEVTIDTAGGHTKLGELIAKAVYEGVKEAIYRQNGLTENRSIFQRLKERNIDISDDISPAECDCGIKKDFFSGKVEKILNMPRYASFISSALSISDDFENGLIKDLTQFNAWCYDVAYDISGRKIAKMEEFYNDEKIPPVVRMAINALLNGIYQKELKKE
ncbi:MAG: ABC transporter substrate-binding protein [Desulfatiglans sp.]|jgi:adenosylcobinamide amidohydrolase/ABC-type Fe3+-hydroxamate transport system substrate-binding protein|nr:ABC transporter substrate-binding protein [Desulfatiglans sp.]